MKEKITEILIGRLPCTARMVLSMELLANGKTLDQAALEMGISSKSVSRHLKRARYRLGAETRTQLIARAVALKIIKVEFFMPPIENEQSLYLEK